MRRWILALAVAVLAAPVAAQDENHGMPVVSRIWQALRSPDQAGWVRPLASAILPGTGQLLAGQERGAVYLVLDAALLVRFAGFQTEARREGNRYRDLAFVVARGAYAPQLRDTTFEYFEQMGRYVESGPFDTDPGPTLSPPTDESSYNGRIWRLARETYFTDPDQSPDPASEEYQRALAFYQSRAIGPNFQWSWRNAGLEQDLFRQTIRNSDEAFRAATRQLGLLLANHVLSAVDAFVSHRLTTGDRPMRVDAAVLGAPGRPLVGILQWNVAF